MGPVTLDLNKLSMSMMLEGKAIQLQGVNITNGELQVVIGASLFSLCVGNKCTFIGQLSFVSNKEQSLPLCLPI